MARQIAPASKRAAGGGAGRGDQGWPDGRYVLAATNADTVAVIADPLTEVNTDASQWLDKTFFKVEKPQTVSVTYPNATNSWELISETNGWKLAERQTGREAGRLAGFRNGGLAFLARVSMTSRWNRSRN